MVLNQNFVSIHLQALPTCKSSTIVICLTLPAPVPFIHHLVCTPSYLIVAHPAPTWNKFPCLGLVGTSV